MSNTKIIGVKINEMEFEKEYLINFFIFRASAREEGAPGGHRGSCDGIRGRIATDPEAIEHDEDDRAWTTHAAASRARAVNPARATIPAISSGLSEAPPTSAPSMVGSARKSAMLAAVTP